MDWVVIKVSGSERVDLVDHTTHKIVDGETFPEEVMGKDGLNDRTRSNKGDTEKKKLLNTNTLTPWVN